MTLHGQHLIAGQPFAAAAPSFAARDAASGAALPPPFSEATADEIDRAVVAAADAFAFFAASPGETRAALLEAIAGEIEALGPALLERAQAETGLPLARLTGERGRTCGQLRLFAAVAREGSWVDARIDPAQPERQPLPRPDIRRMLRALGPVAVFGASNFPLAFSVAGGDTASALATGNPVIVKAHPAHPGTSELVAGAVGRAVAAVGLPPGVFSLLHGSTPETSLALVRHPSLEAVGFTGSTAAGRALYAAAAARERPIPVFAEMGSLNPVFLLPGALQARGAALATAAKNSFTLGVGQFCTKPGLIVAVGSPAWDAFAAALAQEATTVAPAPMLHAGIAAAFTAAVRRLAEVEWLVQGPAAHVARTTVAAWRARPELQHEIFGPFTLLLTARDSAELLAFAATLEGQLVAAVHGEPDELGAEGPLVDRLSRRAGRLVVNGWPTGVEVGHAMHHGGPWPATTDPRFTSVGSAALARFVRPVCFQDFPAALLPPELRDANPLGLLRLVDGRPTREPLT
jgi:alpha-ketoglutaric semialdehyde dehydrogenase